MKIFINNINPPQIKMLVKHITSLVFLMSSPVDFEPFLIKNSSFFKNAVAMYQKYYGYDLSNIS